MNNSSSTSNYRASHSQQKAYHRGGRGGGGGHRPYGGGRNQSGGRGGFSSGSTNYATGSVQITSPANNNTDNGIMGGPSFNPNNNRGGGGGRKNRNKRNRNANNRFDPSRYEGVCPAAMPLKSEGDQTLNEAALTCAAAPAEPSKCGEQSSALTPPLAEQTAPVKLETQEITLPRDEQDEDGKIRDNTLDDEGVSEPSEHREVCESDGKQEEKSDTEVVECVNSAAIPDEHEHKHELQSELAVVRSEDAVLPDDNISSKLSNSQDEASSSGYQTNSAPNGLPTGVRNPVIGGGACLDSNAALSSQRSSAAIEVIQEDNSTANNAASTSQNAPIIELNEEFYDRLAQQKDQTSIKSDNASAVNDIENATENDIEEEEPVSKNALEDENAPCTKPESADEDCISDKEAAVGQIDASTCSIPLSPTYVDIPTFKKRSETLNNTDMKPNDAHSEDQVKDLPDKSTGKMEAETKTEDCIFPEKTECKPSKRKTLKQIFQKSSTRKDKKPQEQIKSKKSDGKFSFLSKLKKSKNSSKNSADLNEMTKPVNKQNDITENDNETIENTDERQEIEDTVKAIDNDNDLKTEDDNRQKESSLLIDRIEVMQILKDLENQDRLKQNSDRSSDSISKTSSFHRSNTCHATKIENAPENEPLKTEPIETEPIETEPLETEPLESEFEVNVDDNKEHETSVCVQEINSDIKSKPGLPNNSKISQIILEIKDDKLIIETKQDSNEKLDESDNKVYDDENFAQPFDKSEHIDNNEIKSELLQSKRPVDIPVFKKKITINDEPIKIPPPRPSNPPPPLILSPLPKLEQQEKTKNETKETGPKKKNKFLKIFRKKKKSSKKQNVSLTPQIDKEEDDNELQLKIEAENEEVVKAGSSESIFISSNSEELPIMETVDPCEEDEFSLADIQNDENTEKLELKDEQIIDNSEKIVEKKKIPKQYPVDIPTFKNHRSSTLSQKAVEFAKIVSDKSEKRIQLSEEKLINNLELEVEPTDNTEISIEENKINNLELNGEVLIKKHQIKDSEINSENELEVSNSLNEDIETNEIKIEIEEINKSKIDEDKNEEMLNSEKSDSFDSDEKPTNVVNIETSAGSLKKRPVDIPTFKVRAQSIAHQEYEPQVEKQEIVEPVDNNTKENIKKIQETTEKKKPKKPSIFKIFKLKNKKHKSQDESHAPKLKENEDISMEKNNLKVNYFHDSENLKEIKNTEENETRKDPENNEISEMITKNIDLNIDVGKESKNINEEKILKVEDVVKIEEDVDKIEEDVEKVEEEIEKVEEEVEKLEEEVEKVEEDVEIIGEELLIVEEVVKNEEAGNFVEKAVKVEENAVEQEELNKKLVKEIFEDKDTEKSENNQINSASKNEVENQEVKSENITDNRKGGKKKRKNKKNRKKMISQTPLVIDINSQPKIESSSKDENINDVEESSEAPPVKPLQISNDKIKEDSDNNHLSIEKKENEAKQDLEEEEFDDVANWVDLQESIGMGWNNDGLLTEINFNDESEYTNLEKKEKDIFEKPENVSQLQSSPKIVKKRPVDIPTFKIKPKPIENPIALPVTLTTEVELTPIEDADNNISIPEIKERKPLIEDKKKSKKKSRNFFSKSCQHPDQLKNESNAKPKKPKSQDKKSIKSPEKNKLEESQPALSNEDKIDFSDPKVLDPNEASLNNTLPLTKSSAKKSSEQLEHGNLTTPRKKSFSLFNKSKVSSTLAPQKRKINESPKPLIEPDNFETFELSSPIHEETSTRPILPPKLSNSGDCNVSTPIAYDQIKPLHPKNSLILLTPPRPPPLGFCNYKDKTKAETVRPNSLIFHTSPIPFHHLVYQLKQNAGQAKRDQEEMKLSCLERAIYKNDDHLFPNSLTPSKIFEHSAKTTPTSEQAETIDEKIDKYDVPFIDDDAMLEGFDDEFYIGESSLQNDFPKPFKLARVESLSFGTADSNLDLHAINAKGCKSKPNKTDLKAQKSFWGCLRSRE